MLALARQPARSSQALYERTVAEELLDERKLVLERLARRGVMTLDEKMIAGGARPLWIGYIHTPDVDAKVAAITGSEAVDDVMGHVRTLLPIDQDAFTGLLELADREFLQIRDRLREGVPDQQGAPDEDPRIGTQDLAAFLAGRFPEAGWSRTDHYDWVAHLLLELGITSLDELGEVLNRVDPAVIDARRDPS